MKAISHCTIAAIVHRHRCHTQDTALLHAGQQCTSHGPSLTSATRPNLRVDDPVSNPSQQTKPLPTLMMMLKWMPKNHLKLIVRMHVLKLQSGQRPATCSHSSDRVAAASCLVLEPLLLPLTVVM